MGWERRGSSNYYYRKKRIGSRVVSEYVGNNVLAEFSALVDAKARRDQRLGRAIQEKAHAQEQRVDEVLLEFERLAQAITRGYLIVHGYHTHKGQWRRKREKGN